MASLRARIIRVSRETSRSVHAEEEGTRRGGVAGGRGRGRRGRGRGGGGKRVPKDKMSQLAAYFV